MILNASINANYFDINNLLNINGINCVFDNFFTDKIVSNNNIKIKNND